MRRPCPYVLLLLLGASTSVTVASQQLTVPEMIASGATRRFATTPSGVPPTLSALLADTDLVVRGVVGLLTSHLSKDRYDVLTDFPLLEPRLLSLDGESGAWTSDGAPPVVITQRGGTYVSDGWQFTDYHDGLPPIEEGTEAIFLLERAGGKYTIAGTYYGAFGIVDGRVRVLSRKGGLARELAGLDEASAIAVLLAAKRRRD